MLNYFVYLIKPLGRVIFCPNDITSIIIIERDRPFFMKLMESYYSDKLREDVMKILDGF